MIRKQDILDRSAEWGLRPEVVEKDYVLGWVLSGFATHAVTSKSWVFKGGTCLKKCYFETYRFSEDLDFSLLGEATYDAASIEALLREIATDVEQRSGIALPPGDIKVRERRNQQGQPTFEGRLAYQGPLKVPSWPRVLIDVTRHEPVPRHSALGCKRSQGSAMYPTPCRCGTARGRSCTISSSRRRRLSRPASSATSSRSTGTASDPDGHRLEH